MSRQSKGTQTQDTQTLLSSSRIRNIIQNKITNEQIVFSITEKQLKILIVIIENLASLAEHGLLDLADEESIDMDGLYQNAKKMQEQFATNNDSYVAQVEYLKNHGK